MFGTARRFDIGAHGDVLMGASSDVITNNRGTHRFTDMVICPIHGVGVTLIACTNKVITNNLPTAHILSLSVCIPPAPIVTGSPDVLVPM